MAVGSTPTAPHPLPEGRDGERAPARGAGFDPQRLKREHPIATVVTAAGVALRPSGRALIGRCPLHDDGGRPNLYVYPQNDSYYCYRCGFGGDAIDFVMRREDVDFLAACARLGGLPAAPSSRPPWGGLASPFTAGGDGVRYAPPRREPEPRWDRLGLQEQEAMNCALTVYRRALWANRTALDYVRRRAVPDWVLRECAVGYADGYSLEAALRRRSLLDVAEALGLFRRLPGRGHQVSGDDGTTGVDIASPSPREAGPLLEALAGRVVVPELRAGQAAWFIGRCLKDRPNRPKYLALGGERPVLGYERAAGQPEAFLCEGPFDYLTAVGWRLPAFSPCGTSFPADRLGFLARARTVYGALDADPAGRAAADRFGALLGHRFVPLALPEGRDLNDLGQRPGGRATFFALLARARRAAPPAAAGAHDRRRGPG